MQDQSEGSPQLRELSSTDLKFLEDGEALDGTLGPSSLCDLDTILDDFRADPHLLLHNPDQLLDGKAASTCLLTCNHGRRSSPAHLHSHPLLSFPAATASPVASILKHHQSLPHVKVRSRRRSNPSPTVALPDSTTAPFQAQPPAPKSLLHSALTAPPAPPYSSPSPYASGTSPSLLVIRVLPAIARSIDLLDPRVCCDANLEKFP